MKRMMTLLLPVLMILTLFSGCNTRKLDQPQPAVVTPEGTPVTLTILSKETSIGGMSTQLEALAEQYMQTHENVTIEIVYPPDYTYNDTSELDIFMEQTRAEIMAGGGPDIFLQPVGTAKDVVITNPEKSMYNGLFHELSAYYNADTELHTEELNQTVMSAGTIGEARYILPLYYDIPVLLVNEEVLAEYGLTVADLGTDLGTLLDVALASEALPITAGIKADWQDTKLFMSSRAADIQNEELLLTEDQLVAFLEKYQRWMLTRNQWPEETDESGRVDTWPDLDQGLNMNMYANAGWYWNKGEIPYCVGDLDGAMISLLMDHAEGTSHTAIPLAAADGQLTAQVTYWGAVNANCKYADVAYDFLRLLLTRESQWEQDRNKVSVQLTNSLRYGSGFPVRIRGAAEPLAEKNKHRADPQHSQSYLGEPEKQARYEGILNAKVAPDALDSVLVDEEIDVVLLENGMSDFHLLLLEAVPYDPNTGKYVAGDGDLRALAKEYLRVAQMKLSES